MDILTKSQLACMAAREWHLYDGRSGGNRRYKNPNDETPIGDTRTILSKKFKVAGHYIQIAKRILDNDTKLFEQIEAGEVRLPIDTILKRKDQSSSFALYRAFDNNGNLLYVGITGSVGERMKAHALGSEWWDEFETLRVERDFISREELEAEETFAIKNENPKYNIRG